MSCFWLKRPLRFRFLYKLLALYICILILTVFLLSTFVLRTMSREILSYEKHLHDQMLARLSDYFESKYNESKNIIQMIYNHSDQDSETPNHIIPFLKDVNADTHYYGSLNFDNYLRSELARYSDISGIVVHKEPTNALHIYTRQAGNPSPTVKTKIYMLLSTVSYNSQGVTIIPSHPQFYSELAPEESLYSFSFCTKIRDPEDGEILGTIIIYYDNNSLRHSYSLYDQDVTGYLLLINDDGYVIYDSSEQYNGKYYKHFTKLQNAPGQVMLDEPSMLFTKKTQVPGITAVSVIPESKLYGRVYEIRRLIYAISLIGLAAAGCISALIITLFDRRVKLITNGMKNIQEGDFSYRLPTKPIQDELDQISLTFNDICMNLEDHIQKVYVANLRQKNAELNALQFQINPHFLYNTLEAIRMNAVYKGDEQTGDMIFLLANFLRSSIKGDMIISVEEEMNFCSMYLQLFHIRYQDYFRVEFDIREDILRYGIIKHLMQPIVENYLVHGFRPEINDNYISIGGRKEGDDIIITFKDNGQGINPSDLISIQESLKKLSSKNNHSVGLTNVNERIRLIFGNAYGLSLQSVQGEGTTVILKVPAIKTEELKQRVQSIDC